MSNYHVMDLNNKLDQARVAFHIVVPDEANAASVNLRTAVFQHLAPTSIVPFILSAEQTQIEAGAIYEHVINVEFNANLTVVEKRDIIDSKFTALNSTIPDIIRDRYKFWGLNRDVT